MKTLLHILLFLSGITFSRAQNAERIFSKTNDAVVKILAYHEDGTLHGQGSGVIVKKNEWVVTNYHVLGDAVNLFAEHEGKKIKLDSIIAFDEKKDILVIHLAMPKNQKEFKSIPDLVLEKSKNLRIGQKIYAIGSPMGFENTITEGIISGLRTSFDSSQNYIQISAPISSGSSGGAVLNEKGKLIGISSMVIAGQTAQNLNFAIFIDDVIKASVAKNNILQDKSSELEFYYQKGYSEYLSKHYLSAILSYEKALRFKASAQDIATLCYASGLAYQRLGMPDSAIRFYGRSVVKKETPDVYVSMGEAYEQKKDHIRAIFSYEKALDVDSAFAPAYAGLGMLHYLKGDFAKALKFLQKSLQFSKVPEPRALYTLGLIAVKLNMTEQAHVFFKDAISFYPAYAEVYLELSKLYLKEEQTEKAAEYQQKAYQLKPELREAR